MNNFSSIKLEISSTVLIISSFFFSFASLKDNRVLSGTGLYLVPDIPLGFLLICFVLCSILILFFAKNKSYPLIFVILSMLFSIWILLGVTGFIYIPGSNTIARISPGIGFILFNLGLYLFLFSILKQPRYNKYKKTTSKLIILFILLIVILFFAGFYKHLSVVKEFFSIQTRFINEFFNHLIIVGASIACALLIGLPLGILSAKNKLLANPIITFAGSVQTIPSLALFGLLIAPLAYLSKEFPILRTIGIKGIGNAPAIIALTLYGLLPIVLNTYTGITLVDKGVLEAGRGMGMSKSRLLFTIEIPLAIPIIITGIKTAMVQSVGNTAVAALIGAGGMGVFIFQGLGQSVSDLILLGTLPIIAIALSVDRLMNIVKKAITPKGILVYDRAK